MSVKCRVWDRVNKAWIKPAIELTPLHKSDNYKEMFLEPKDWEAVCDFLFFTGLTDKQGTEVCEDDILSVDDGARIVRVTWNKYCGMWDTAFISQKSKFQQFTSLRNADWKYRAVIIGNAQDNPELLKTKAE